MNHKEFFKILVGNPPPEIEFEIEVKQRETEQMPEETVRAYCLDLVKYTKTTGFAFNFSNNAYIRYRN